jgi:SmpA / OmlA family
MRANTVILALLVLAAGCGGHPVAVSTDGAGVASDARDGHLDRNWSCGSLRAAVARSSPAQLEAAGAQAATGKACDRAVEQLKVGTTRSTVRETFGPPMLIDTHRPGRCWFYTWPRSLTLTDAGSARICFNGNKVSLVQRTHAFRSE